jgi:hypothetical protein
VPRKFALVYFLATLVTKKKVFGVATCSMQKLAYGWKTSTDHGLASMIIPDSLTKTFGNLAAAEMSFFHSSISPSSF